MINKTLLLLFSLTLLAYAIDKSQFDVTQPNNSLSKINGQSNASSYAYCTSTNEYSEISLLTGGYFTIGTHNGLSASTFDNECKITFGHPYALTSYPLFAIDGKWGKLEEFTTDGHSLEPVEITDILKIQTILQDVVHVIFQIATVNEGKEIELFLSIKNGDTSAHKLGFGLVYDPAMGQWEDGYVQFENQMISEGQINKEEIGQLFSIAERQQSPYGLRTEISLNDNVPDLCICANWSKIYDDPTPGYSAGELSDLYDLCLKLIWQEQTLQPQQERSFKINVKLLPPDFPSLIFMRWDMPSALTLVDNLLFPQHILTSVRVMNHSPNHLNGLKLQLKYPYEFSGTESTNDFYCSASASVYPQVSTRAREIYEDKIVPIEIVCELNGSVVDHFSRNIFVPAIPVSDEGLSVTIDSTSVVRFPDMDIIFTAEIEETGQRLLNLQKEHIFLYENEKRIRDFSLKKFDSGGGGLADVCFVIDCSSSMGNEINQVRNYVGEFADSLQQRGYDFRIAVVTFSTTVDDVWDFINNIETIKSRLASIQLWGGIEDSPSALYRASQLSWRDGSKRNIIWITDEPYPEHNYTQEDIVNRMLSMNIKVHGVGLLELQTDWFNPIVLPTGGNFYDINGNFRDILLDVSSMKSQDRYHLSYRTSLAQNDPKHVQLEVHYAGLGGFATADITGVKTLMNKKLVCYPNPFNPVVQIQVETQEIKQGHVNIYNLLGQCVRHYELKQNRKNNFVWDAIDDMGIPVGSGFYLVSLSTRDKNGHIFNQTEKILYLK